MASEEDLEARVGQAVVEFASHGALPNEEDVSAAIADAPVLSAAHAALEATQTDLETEIGHISRESAANVEAWMANANSLLADLDKSRKLANEVVRQAEAQENSRIEELEAHVEFLQREALYNSQLGDALQSIKDVDVQLRQVDKLATETRILDCLGVLDNVYATIESSPIPPQAVRLLYRRYGEKKDVVFDHFMDVWKALIKFDVVESTVTINESVTFDPSLNIQGSPTTISDAATILSSYNLLDEFAVQIWENMDRVILKPRTDIRCGSLRSMEIDGSTIALLRPAPDPTVKCLFDDIESFIRLLAKTVPKEILRPLANAMMPVLSNRIKEEWLDRSVPTSFEHLAEYQATLRLVDDFADKLKSMEWPGSDTFTAWAKEAPMIWLTKKRETSLDMTRNHIALGVGKPTVAEHVETHMVSRDEGNNIATTGNMVNQDWDAAWDSDDNPHAEAPRPVSEETASSQPDDDDGAYAWGWGDDDTEAPVAAHPASIGAPAGPKSTSEKREVTLSEKYSVSSIPQPIYVRITGIYDDGAKLSKLDNSPISKAVVGLFGLPTLVLAMYRAVSPYYYSKDPCGNMYIYNDTMWLSDRMKEYIQAWQSRDHVGDLAPGIVARVKLEPEIKALQSFGKRAYAAEMSRQRQIIDDHLGGTQNFFEEGDLEPTIEIVNIHIRNMSTSWSTILPPSALSSAIGSLVNKVASKLISDTFDLPDIDTDLAQQIAKIISKVVELDDMFTEGKEDEDEVAQTAKFAGNWMKFQFLGEVLQSTLAEIKYLWFESELSLWMTKAEVVELIDASFADNMNSRKLKKEISESKVAGE